jgi:hypothetical protein
MGAKNTQMGGSSTLRGTNNFVASVSLSPLKPFPGGVTHHAPASSGRTRHIHFAAKVAKNVLRATI